MALRPWLLKEWLAGRREMQRRPKMRQEQPLPTNSKSKPRLFVADGSRKQGQNMQAT